MFVRFMFENGARLGSDGLFWLEVHCANCEGSTDKKRWRERSEWAAQHRKEIQRISNDPACTFEIWKEKRRRFSM